jgi:hypothetical protein
MIGTGRPQCYSYPAPPELQRNLRHSNYKYFVPPGLKIYELYK